MKYKAPVVRKEGILLQSTTLEFESEGVLNPACIQVGNTVHMYYRAVRPGNHSTVGYCRLEGPLHVAERCAHPVVIPDHAYECHGVEDPRTVRIDGTTYLNYTAYDGHNALGALAVGTSPTVFNKVGITTPMVTHAEFVEYIDCSSVPLNRKYYQHYTMLKSMGGLSPSHLVWDKDTVMFPRKINGKFAMLHRLFPGIQIVYFDTPKELSTRSWIEYLTRLPQHIVMDPVHRYESSHIGGGCPPIETEDGWVMIYHAVRETPTGKEYTAAAALLDLHDPRVCLARLPRPLFCPEEPWEKKGVVNNVVFPTGTSLFGDRLYIYYGAADQRIGAASVSFTELLAALKHVRADHHQ